MHDPRLVPLLALGLVVAASTPSAAQEVPRCSDPNIVQTVRELVTKAYPGSPRTPKEAERSKVDPQLSFIRTVPRNDGVHLCRAGLVIHVDRWVDQPPAVSPGDFHGDQTLGDGTISYTVEVTDDGQPFVTLLRGNP